MGELVPFEEGQRQLTRVDDRRWLSTVELNLRVTKVKEVMASQMKEGTHYGTIPGCKKPSLWQPGAEILGMTFQFAPRFKHEKHWRGNVFEVFTTCELYEVGSNIFVGDSTRSCSTDEKKYAWRRALCDEEFASTPAEMKQLAWEKKSGRQDEYYQVKQIRTNPSDLINTIVGMCEKRAYVAAIRRATAASEVFTEGLEQLPEELLQMLIEESDDDPELVRKISEALNKRQNPHAAGNTRAAQVGGSQSGGTGWKITFGKNAGKTFAEVGENSTRWYAENAKREDERAAAQDWLNSLGKAAPAEDVQSAQDYEPQTIDPNDTAPADYKDPFADQG